MVDTSTTVSFADETTSNSISTELELDGDYHISLYGSEKSTFSKTELVYLKVKPIYSVEPYTIQTSAGACVKNSQGLIEEKIEFLAFANTNSASLSYEPIGSVTTEWTSGNGGSVLKNGRVMKTNSPALAILKCTYEIKYDRLKLTVPSSLEDTEVLVMVGSELYGYDTETVDYTGTAGTLVDVTLTIKDVMTDAVIPEATVEISKSGIVLFTGVSNASGELTVPGICATGETYDIKTTASLYFDSDVDYLNNDSFTVPVS